ncbi:hypothetical protein Pmani_019047 [Petrolisthes manimaculis]|uniref:Uncharacterized protein n=1 Tax=Petrolisthes manimaculis TaxID=1843537 RepID=A0AAE1PLM4_9EUCA|nr:hypothetical protein Pmani_019047 [Petrolisthes manimaculis]
MSVGKAEKSKKYMSDECEGISRDEGEDLAALMEQELRDYDDCVDESLMEKHGVNEVANSKGYERFLHKEKISSVTTTTTSTTLYGFEEDGSTTSSTSAAQELETIPKEVACTQQDSQFKHIFNDKVEHLKSMLAEGDHDNVTVPELDSYRKIPIKKLKEILDDGDTTADSTADRDDENSDADGIDSEVEGMTCTMFAYDNDGSSEDKEKRGNAVKHFVRTNIHLENKRGDLDPELIESKNFEMSGDENAGNDTNLTNKLSPVPEAVLSSKTAMVTQEDQELESAGNLGVNTHKDIKEVSSSIPENSGAIQVKSVSRPFNIRSDMNDTKEFVQDESRDVTGAVNKSVDGDEELDTLLSPLLSTHMYSGGNSEEDSLQPGNDLQESGRTNPDIGNMTVMSLSVGSSSSSQDPGMEEGIDIKETISNTLVSKRCDKIEDHKDQKLKDQKSIVSDDECDTTGDGHIEDDSEQTKNLKYPVSDNDSSIASSAVDEDLAQDLADQRAIIPHNEFDVTRNSELKTDTYKDASEQKKIFSDVALKDNKIMDIDVSLDQDITVQKTFISGDESSAKRSNTFKDSLEEELMDMDGELDVNPDRTDKVNDIDNSVRAATTKERAVVKGLTAEQTKIHGAEEKLKHLDKNTALTEAEKNVKVVQNIREKSPMVQQGKQEINEEQSLKQTYISSETAQNVNRDAVNQAVSNVAIVKRKLEEILETSKAEEEAAIQELEKMKREKTQILNKLTSEMVRLKTMLLRDKDRKQEK